MSQTVDYIAPSHLSNAAAGPDGGETRITASKGRLFAGAPCAMAIVLPLAGFAHKTPSAQIIWRLPKYSALWLAALVLVHLVVVAVWPHAQFIFVARRV